MLRRTKLLMFPLICIGFITMGLFFLFSTPSFTSDAKTLNTTVRLFCLYGLTWQQATADTYTKTLGGVTYTLYGGNGTYSVKQGTDGPDPDFDWGHAYINSSSTSNSHSTSGSASSLKKCH